MHCKQTKLDGVQRPWNEGIYGSSKILSHDSGRFLLPGNQRVNSYLLEIKGLILTAWESKGLILTSWESKWLILTSWESKGLIPDFMSMFASTRYFRHASRLHGECGCGCGG